jgi:hypothetical protein
MRRIQIVMDLELDDWLARESVALGISKSALVRECVRRKASAPVPDNGLWLLPIFDDVEPVEDIDAEIYGPFEADA